MEVEVKIVGLQELEARLQELGALAGQKLITRVFRKTLKPMYETAAANARVVGRSGALANSVALFARKPKGQQVARVAVGSRAKNRTSIGVHNVIYGRKRKGIFYGWMLDQGHRISGESDFAWVRPRRWWTPAVQANEQQAVSSFISELTKAVARLEKRTGKTASPDSLVPE